MDDHDALEAAFAMDAEWQDAIPNYKGILHRTPYCPDCEVKIAKTPGGFRCSCSQWRFGADGSAERRKMVGEDWKNA